MQPFEFQRTDDCFNMKLPSSYKLEPKSRKISFVHNSLPSCPIPLKSCIQCKNLQRFVYLTHWGQVTLICVSDLARIGSDNGLSPGRCQAIIRTNAGVLLIRPLGTNFSEFLVEILIFSIKKTRLKVSSAKRRPFCLGLNKLNGF